MPTPSSMRGVFDDLEEDPAALASLMSAARDEVVRTQLDDTIRRLRQITRTVSGSKEEGLVDLARRLQRIKALVAPQVTRRSRKRTRKMKSKTTRS